MFLRTVFLSLALIAFPLIVDAADSPPGGTEQQAAIDDAFVISIYDPEFVAAANAGQAYDMKRILVANGAPNDLVLTAYGMFAQSTSGTPVPALYPNNDGPCIQWQWVWWPTGPNSYGWMKVCVAIMEHGVMTYDAR